MKTNTQLERQQELTALLVEANEAYYMKDAPTMSDHKYDALYEELEALEKKTKIIYANSPTQRVQGGIAEYLEKEIFSEPMLSAQKAHTMEEILNFSQGRPLNLSWKEDGLTLVLEYQDGQLQKVLTRGTGLEGENVLHNAQYVASLPRAVPCPGKLTVRGECVMPWSAYWLYKMELDEAGEECGHPRNITSGCMRRLQNSPQEVQKLGLVFKAFCLVESGEDIPTKSGQLQYLEKLGFNVVENQVVTTREEIKQAIETFQPKEYWLPVDGLILEFEDTAYGHSLGTTNKYPRWMRAYKWANETVTTKFRGIELNTTRTGMVSMTALYDKVSLGHTSASRATVPNLNYFEKFRFGIGDEITVYKANDIIPQIEENLTQSGTYQLPMVCPSCGGPLRISQNNDTRVLRCDNNACPARHVRRYVHFCARDRMNIAGVSKGLLQLFVSHGWIHKFADIYRLSQYREEIIELPGQGEKSYENLIAAVEASRHTRLYRLLAGQGIPNIGRTASKTIDKWFGGDLAAFLKAVDERFDFTALDDFGEIMNQSLYDWWNAPGNRTEFFELVKELELEQPPSETAAPLAQPLQGKTIVATGTLVHFKRNEIKDKIESLGGKASSSVSKKTDFVLAGESAGSKLVKAQELGVPVIDEAAFLKMIGEDGKASESEGTPAQAASEAL